MWRSRPLRTLTLVSESGANRLQVLPFLPIRSLIAYLCSRAASVNMDDSPDFAVQSFLSCRVAGVIVVGVAVPYALQIRAKAVIPGVHLTTPSRLPSGAVYVLNDTSLQSVIPLIFPPKQDLGGLCAVSIIGSGQSFCIAAGTSRALIAIGWESGAVARASQKAALAFAPGGDNVFRRICCFARRTRMTPRYRRPLSGGRGHVVSNPIGTD